jgi:hypothetical protein
MTPADISTFLAAALAGEEVRLTLGASTLLYGVPVGIEGHRALFRDRGEPRNSKPRVYPSADLSDVRRLPLGVRS